MNPEEQSTETTREEMEETTIVQKEIDPKSATTTTTPTSTTTRVVEEESSCAVDDEAGTNVDETAAAEAAAEALSLVLFTGTDRNEVGRYGYSKEDGSWEEGEMKKSVPDLEGWKMGIGPDGLCTDVLVMHPSKQVLFAVASFGSSRPSVVVTYRIVGPNQQLERIGSSSTVGYRAIQACITANGQYLMILHAQESILTIFEVAEDGGALPKAPMVVQDLTSYLCSFDNLTTTTTTTTTTTNNNTDSSSFFTTTASSSNQPVTVHSMTLTTSTSTNHNQSLLLLCDAIHARIYSIVLDTNGNQLLSCTVDPTICLCKSPTSWFSSDQSWSNLALRFSSGIRPIQTCIIWKKYLLILYESIHVLSWHTIHTNNNHNHHQDDAAATTTSMASLTNIIIQPDLAGSISTLPNNNNQQHDNTNETTSSSSSSSYAVATQMICSQDESTIYVIHTSSNPIHNAIVTFQVKEEEGGNIQILPLHTTQLNGTPLSCILTQNQQLIVATTTTTTDNHSSISIYSTASVGPFSDNNDDNGDGLQLVSTHKVKDKIWSMTSPSNESLLQPSNTV